MAKSFVRLERGERVDAPDAQALSLTSQLGAAAQAVGVLARDVVSSLITQPPSPGLILRGFQATVPSGTIVRVTRDVSGPGAAILAAMVDNQLITGFVVDGGEASIDIDVATYSAGTYGIWLRAVLLDSEARPRAVWVPGVSPQERIRSLMTRRAENWEIAIEAQQPGPGWTRIYDLSRAGMTLTDRRRYLFEGRADATTAYLLENADWGTDDDREDDRSIYGVASLERVIKATLRQIQDIIGAGALPWTQRPHTGTLAGLGPRSLFDLNAGKLDRSGNNEINGAIIPDGDATRNWGSGARRFLTGYFRDLAVTTITNAITVAGAIAPSANLTHDIGSTGTRWRDFFGRNVDLTGDLDADEITANTVTGGLISSVAQVVAGTSVDAPTVNAANINAATRFSGPYTISTSNPGGTPVANALYASNMLKAAAFLVIDSGLPGGIAAALSHNLNIGSLSLPTSTTFRITFDRPFTGAFLVLPYAAEEAVGQCCIREVGRTLSTIDFALHGAYGSVDLDLTTGQTWNVIALFMGVQ